MLGRWQLSVRRVGFFHGNYKSSEPLGVLQQTSAFSSVSKADDKKEEPPTSPPAKQSWLQKVFSPDRVYAKPEFKNRWAMTVPAFLTHMCIGSPWAWSVLSTFVHREHGFVSPAVSDWSFSDVTMPMSLIFASQGICAALSARWSTRVGPRAAMSFAAACFGGGMVVGGLGVSYHSLPLLYLGYGILTGCGVGLAYTPPVQCLIEWFPDKKGIASGLALAGFGSGALVFAPLSQYIAKQFARMPEYLGPTGSLPLTSEAGKLFANVGDTLREVVIAGKSDLATLPYQLSEGIYAVDTGYTGVAHVLTLLGLGYYAIMTASAFAIRRPAKGYVPEGWSPSQQSASPVVAGNVHFDQVMKTPQFYQLATTFFLIACGGMGVFSVAKPMMSEVFSSTLPAIVTSAFASSYVVSLSAGNLFGRLGWGIFSDKFGRRTTFNIFTWGSIPLYLMVPFCVQQTVETKSIVPLGMYMGATVLAISCMGGTYALMPAYESDLFGNKYVGPTHARFLLASTAASIVGPTVLLKLRSMSEHQAVMDLISKIDPIKFQEKFGASIESAEQLFKSKAINISKLMEIVGPGVPDPSPFIYNTTMYTMAAFMFAAAISHQMVKPVNPKHFEDNIAKAKAEGTAKTP